MSKPKKKLILAVSSEAETQIEGFGTERRFKNALERWEHIAQQAEDQYGTRYSKEAVAFIAERANPWIEKYSK